MKEAEFVEAAAALEHARWARWQSYLHSKAQRLESGCLLIPEALVAHWERQIATPYADLSEREKESDREQVREYLPLVHQCIGDALLRYDTRSTPARADGDAGGNGKTGE